MEQEELSVTIKARSIPELRQKLIAVLGEIETEKREQVAAVDFPDYIVKLYPRCQENPHSAAMLTVLHEKHKGKTNAVESYDLAKEMIDRFPALFKGKKLKEVSWGNIFAGTYLKKKGLVNIDIVKDPTGFEYRRYWVT